MVERWPRRGLALTSLVVLGVVFIPEASARNRYLVKARQAYEDLNYPDAMALAERARKSKSTPQEELEIYELLATVYAIYGRDADAQAAFLEVLRRNPEFDLPPDTSPKIRGALGAARQKLEAGGSQSPATPAPVTETPAPMEIKAGEVRSSQGPSRGGTESTGPLPLATGERVAPATPHLLGPPITTGTGVERNDPFYASWWFWTAVGVVVAGGAGYLAWSLTRPTIPRHDFGPVRLR